MSLLKYFSRVKTKDGLPDPCGPLNEAVPSSSIEEANKEVSAQLASVDDSGKKRRATYMIATLEQKAKVGKYAAENGTTKAIRHFAKDIPCLKESTVRGWKTIYLRELAAKVKAGEDLSIEQFPATEKGRPLLLGQDLNHQVRAYLMLLRDVGGIVNTSIAIAAATGIIRRHNSNLLAVNGGHIVLTKHWAQYLMQRMGFVNRKPPSRLMLKI